MSANLIKLNAVLVKFAKDNTIHMAVGRKKKNRGTTTHQSNLDASEPIGDGQKAAAAPKGRFANFGGKAKEAFGKAKSAVKKNPVSAVGAAGVAGAAVGSAASSKKEAMLRVVKTAAARGVAPVSDARLTGLVHGMMTVLMPADDVFQKAAETTNMPFLFVKQAYLKKNAVKHLPWILGALGLGLGAAALPSAASMVRDPMRYYNWHPYDLSQEGGLSPDQLNRHTDITMQEGRRSRQMSQMLQGMSGAYNPAPSPWGAGASGGMNGGR